MVRWYLQSGPNNSHLQDARWLDTLREARNAIEALPLAPTGEPRPYRLHRVKFSNLTAGWSKIIDSRVIDERVMK